VCGELLCEIVYDELNWSKVFHVKHEEAGSPNAKQRFNSMLKNKAHLFEDGYDSLKGHETHIRAKPEAKPVFHIQHKAPYALREPVEAELRKIEENGVIKK